MVGRRRCRFGRKMLGRGVVHGFMVSRKGRLRGEGDSGRLGSQEGGYKVGGFT